MIEFITNELEVIAYTTDVAVLARDAIKIIRVHASIRTV